MTETMYEKLGISKEVYEFGQTIEAGLKERFSQMDEVAEYNQLKVLHAMQENKVSEGCFNYASGYGYNDMGRDTLEQVYASTFHTEAALVRPQITCGTHALALALAANLRPGFARQKVLWQSMGSHTVRWSFWKTVILIILQSGRQSMSGRNW